MTHGPAFWIAFVIAVYVIFDATRTLRMISRASDEWDKKTVVVKLMCITLVASIGLLALVAYMEHLK